ncbi:uncharacterized protein LOC107484595 [Arachis duranensis]|uniref:Uncharacterized protein LOC107484595 n=1 Tax=Arachis duranensis TaxID=130453 RepID=A0A6P4D1T4_ARADU|nr:uncharacterized protein LOC107484595 [Arachis duranensis]
MADLEEGGSQSHLAKGTLKKYIVVFDPLDGSSNIECGISIGTIFGIYVAKDKDKVTLDDVLQPENRMLATGYYIGGIEQCRQTSSVIQIATPTWMTSNNNHEQLKHSLAKGGVARCKQSSIDKGEWRHVSTRRERSSERCDDSTRACIGGERRWPSC